MSYIIDAASPAPGPLLKGKAGSGQGGDGSTDPLDWGEGGLSGGLASSSHPATIPSCRGLRGGNSLDLKVQGFDFVFLTPFTPLVLLLSWHYKAGRSLSRIV